MENLPKRVKFSRQNKILCLIVCIGLILTDSDYNYILKAGDFSIPLSQIQYLNLKDSASVPQGYILAIGDNHEVSVDSRTYGFVSERNILGKVLCK